MTGLSSCGRSCSGMFKRSQLRTEIVDDVGRGVAVSEALDGAESLVIPLTLTLGL